MVRPRPLACSLTRLTGHPSGASTLMALAVASAGPNVLIAGWMTRPPGKNGLEGRLEGHQHDRCLNPQVLAGRMTR
jgi:hypothetical protein